MRVRRVPIRSLLWVGGLVVITALLLWSRLAGLDQSFWHDEVVTVMRYAGQGPTEIFFGPYIPNNHVLFEVLAWATTRIFGESEVAYRLWGFLPALGATGLVTWWGFRRFGNIAGTALLLLMTASPLLLQLSREARGYGLTMLAMAGLISQADSALLRPDSGAVWRFSAFGGMGVLTLPVFVIPFLLGAIPLAVERRLRSRVIMGILGSGVVALLWYFPSLVEILESSSQQFGLVVPWHGPVTLALPTLLFPTLRLLMPGVPDITLGSPIDPVPVFLSWHAVGWSLIGFGGYLLWKRNRRGLLAVLTLMIFGTYLVLAVFGLWVANRHVSFSSLPLFVLIALGVKQLLRLVPGRGGLPMTVAMATVTLWILISFYPLAETVAHVPHEALKDAAQLANATGADLVVTNSARPAGFQYYLQSAPRVMETADLESLFCSDQSAYVFIEHPFRAEDADTSCLEAKDASRVRIEQQGRGLMIDVWFVGLAAVDTD